MKKTFFYASLIFPVVLVLFCLIAAQALADGMVIIPGSGGWDYDVEGSQEAFIHYEDGIEKMILSINIGFEIGGNKVWIFPVPGAPEQVEIDIMTAVPYLSGEDLSGRAKSNLVSAKQLAFATQIYSLPFVSYFDAPSDSYDTEESFGIMARSESWGKSQDVVVHARLEKEGMVSEVITARTGNGIYDYLNSKGLEVEIGAIPVLQEYVGGDYSFVASWIGQETDGQYDLAALIDQADRFAFEQRGIFVSFPTDKIYYPLRPTSVYGDEIVPATIRVLGYVSPQIFSDLEPYISTEYFIDYDYFDFEGLESFYDKQVSKVKYTKIEIDAPSKLLTDDLWIAKEAPGRVVYSSFIAEHGLATTLILFVLISVIMGIILGLIIFRKSRSVLRYGLLGLSNCLSIIGFALVVIFTRTREQNASDANLLGQIREKGYIWKRKLALVVLILDFPFLFFCLFAWYNLIINSLNFQYFDFSSFLLAVVPVLVLVFVILIRKIRAEDRNLFSELRTNHYSSWTFQPKDKRKAIFIPVFSVSFLIVSWLVIWLLEITV